jgi:hypothetical protein
MRHFVGRFPPRRLHRQKRMEMHKFTCNATLANKVMGLQAERHEALVIAIVDAIGSAIIAHDKHEISLGCTHSTPVEINTALADTIVHRMGLQQNDIEKFVDELRTLADPDSWDWS